MPSRRIRVTRPSGGWAGGESGAASESADGEITLTMYLYQLGWGPQKSFGRASAVAWILFLIIIVIGALNFWLTRRISSAEGKKARR